MITDADVFALTDALCPFAAAVELGSDPEYLSYYRKRQHVQAWLEFRDDIAPDARRSMARAVAAWTEALGRYEHRAGDAGRVGQWIPTISGRRLFIEDPRPGEIVPFDVAYGLARVPRFNGTTDGLHCYSVAQHSVIGSYLVEEPFQLHFLLHDAHEYVSMDVTSPIKRALGAAYAVFEGRLKHAVAERFDIEWTDEAAAECKRVDNLLLVAELDSQTPWGVTCGRLPAPPSGIRIDAMSGRDAFEAYADRLNDVYGEDVVEFRQGSGGYQ